MLDSIDKVVLAIADVLYQPWCVPLLLIAGGIRYVIEKGDVMYRIHAGQILWRKYQSRQRKAS